MIATRVVVLGSGPGRRFEAFKEAAHRAGLSNIVPLAYGQKPDLRPGDWLRFDSPDESEAAMQAVLDAGQEEARRRGFPCQSPLSSAQLAFGLRALQREAVAPGVYLSASPDEIALCYDKTGCAAHLSTLGIPVPQVFAPPPSFEAFLELLRAQKRLFVKQRYGAGAAGTMAVTAGPKGQVVAYTTLAIGAAGPRPIKRVQKVTDRKDIEQMFTFLHPFGLHVERWIPKAGVDGRSCDLRIVAIRNAPPFAVLRLSQGPITNLHLDAERADADRLFTMMAPERLDALWDTIAKVQAAFPNSLSVAPDIAISADLRRHYVLEVNAFGDHIRRMTIDGRTPQDWQIKHMLEARSHAA